MEYFARMEAGDEEALKLWNQFRSMSIENLKEVYRVKSKIFEKVFLQIFQFQLFNIRYDEYQFESQFSQKSREIIEQLNQLGYCHLRDDGVREAVIPARYNSLARDARVVVQKSDGTTLYITRFVDLNDEKYSKNMCFRDIAALKSRLETMSIDKILYVVRKTNSRQTFVFIFVFVSS